MGLDCKKNLGVKKMSLPKYLKDKSRKRKSINQEKRLAKRGFRMPASGALWPFKGDVEFERYLTEAKRTDKKSIRVCEQWLALIFDQATNKGKLAGIELEFKDYYVQGIVFRKGRRGDS